MRPVHQALLASLVLILGLATPTYGKDEPDGDGAAVLAELGAAAKHAEREGLEAAIEKSVEAHNQAAPALKKKFQAALGKALRDKRGGGASVAAAVALSKLDDREGAFKQLAAALPQPKSKDASPAQLEALRAVGAMAHEKAIAPLLKLVQKGKSLTAVKEAVAALGGYGSSKKRAAILKVLLDSTSRHHAAAQSAAKNPKGGSGGAPWEVLGETLIASMNRLTGQSFTDGPAWLDAYRANKKKLGALFPADAG